MKLNFIDSNSSLCFDGIGHFSVSVSIWGVPSVFMSVLIATRILAPYHLRLHSRFLDRPDKQHASECTVSVREYRQDVMEEMHTRTRCSNTLHVNLINLLFMSDTIIFRLSPVCAIFPWMLSSTWITASKSCANGLSKGWHNCNWNLAFASGLISGLIWFPSGPQFSFWGSTRPTTTPTNSFLEVLSTTMLPRESLTQAILLETLADPK